MGMFLAGIVCGGAIAILCVMIYVIYRENKGKYCY